MWVHEELAPSSDEVKRVESIFVNAINVKTVAQIRKKLEELKPTLQQKYQVENIGVFGSYTRGQQTAKSDVDVLVEFAVDAHIGLFKFVDLELFLSDQLGVKVDLVAKGGLKPALKDRILSEVVYV